MTVVLPLVLRFASIYHYDKELFQAAFPRWRGGHLAELCAEMVSLFAFAQDIDKFWEHLRGTEFFEMHPILSDPVLWLLVVRGGCK